MVVAKNPPTPTRTRILKLLIVGLTVILLGTVIISYMEDWKFLDGLYSTMATVTTIGYGDFTPQTDGGKIYFIFYSLLGVGTFFYILSIIIDSKLV